MVRTVKVYLESLKLLDKTRSIAKVEEQVLTECFAVNSPYTIALLPPHAVQQISTSTAALIVSGLTCSDSEYSNLMAVPITAAFDVYLHNNVASMSKTKNNAADNIDVSTVLLELSKMTNKSTLLLGRYCTRTSKRTQINSFQHANDLLSTLSQRHNLAVCSNNTELVSRFEIVGDVLMLPANYLTGEKWNSILGLSSELNMDNSDTLCTDAAAAAVEEDQTETNPEAANYRRAVFASLAECFGLQRVARKAEIDSGPKRESRVRMLHPVVGLPRTTGPSSPGWVVVHENKIAYSFDITRVMFCSGNVTERMRMGQQSSRDQVVVDLYCGVGYYTVPLLLHGKARHIHACEWNPNSILSLRENLRLAGVSDRCTVYEGDNQISSVQLVDLADRVLLGLLPSSVKGWPLAARALKACGGIIHVHENVLESILHTWVEETRLKFETLLLEHGKPMKVSIVHLEKVKSYAPRVYHVVLDLVCTAFEVI